MPMDMPFSDSLFTASRLPGSGALISKMCIRDSKSFDMFEKEIVGDIVMTRIPEDWTAEKIF